MEPSFKYIKNPESGNKESVAIETKNADEQNKEAEIIQKKKAHKYGSSLGWGWFQGFNLFVTGCFLIICLIVAYFMMGSETMRTGLPKYSIDRTNDLGKAIYNPALSEEERASFVYQPPVRRPKATEKPVLDEIELLSEATKNPSANLDLPALSLISSAEEDEAEHAEENFYGDSPFGLTMESLQLESSSQTVEQNVMPSNPEVQSLVKQATLAWNRGQLSEPYQGSALSYYHQALAIDANDQSALTGLSQLATHYLNLAKKELGRNDFFSALDYVDLGLKADPLNPELNQLKAQLINE
ncbi:tetratricopeptide repeat protein [Wohlfahrtiimonas larvae]|uniref:Tetratricopeptide repeat-like domain-containing protein n=1 Tax=Wohlfahrtiimonas larvae TaxID=1157986 RepID=A0ABP9MKN4_9GAMM|nr:tetratricopeptide repeat protein [Wohlfahrtiimonas larvae]